MAMLNLTAINQIETNKGCNLMHANNNADWYLDDKRPFSGSINDQQHIANDTDNSEILQHR